MPVQTSKFGKVFRSRRRQTTFENVQPQGGFHSGLAPNLLPAGFSPSLQNLVGNRDGRVQQRPGLAVFGSYSFNSFILGATEVSDKDGNLAGFAPSTDSVFNYLHPDNQAWSSLTYFPGAGSDFTVQPSAVSSEYWSTEEIWVPSLEKVIAVTSNNSLAGGIQWFNIEGSTVTYSDFTHTDSLGSTAAAKSITAVNDRLVFFNTVEPDGTRFPNRVLWSVRGNPIDYNINSGAGFEDLKDMRGVGQSAVRYKDIMILFTDQEIWRAIPTLDAYAFRFERMADSFGCNLPQTITETPEGAVFLGKDFEVYITTGVQIIPLGPVGAQGSSRIKKILQEELVNKSKAFGVYNQTERRYELYYSTATASDGWCNKALFYYFDDQTWWVQKFPFSFSAGLDLEDPAALVTWDSISGTWDANTNTWENFLQTTGSRSVNLFDSTVSTFRYRSNQTTDHGTAIDCTWRSPGLNQQGNGQFSQLVELYVDHENSTPSSMSVYMSTDLGDTFDSGYSFAVSENKRKTFVPVWATAKNPQFELRWNDGGTQQLSLVEAKLRSSSNFGAV